MLFNDNLNYFKAQYRHIIFYSIPFSILFIVRKRLNLIFLILVSVACALLSVF
jgi:hypothetical protein